VKELNHSFPSGCDLLAFLSFPKSKWGDVPREHIKLHSQFPPQLLRWPIVTKPMSHGGISKRCGLARSTSKENYHVNCCGPGGPVLPLNTRQCYVCVHLLYINRSCPFRLRHHVSARARDEVSSPASGMGGLSSARSRLLHCIFSSHYRPRCSLRRKDED
jgi:hypothetical protein